MKRALITGITGQDGSFLAEQLLARGYEVHGIVRRSSSLSRERIDRISWSPRDAGDSLHLHYGDVADSSRLTHLMYEIQPAEVYHLAAQSHVRVSFDIPEHTADVTGMGTIRVLEAIRDAGLDARFYQASSSEMFGSTPPPHDESTPFHPRSPYGVAKVTAFWATVNHREAYGVHASNGILFNHESERRGENFVSRKVSRGLAEVYLGRRDKIALGNLDARRDWGYAPDYTEAMWLMLQQEEPDDYVIATGEMRSVRELLDEAAGCLGVDWRDHVEIDPRYLRPAEVEALCGDASKARERLGWAPKTSFEEMVRIMVDADLRQLEGDPASDLATAGEL